MSVFRISQQIIAASEIINVCCYSWWLKQCCDFCINSNSCQVLYIHEKHRYNLTKKSSPGYRQIKRGPKRFPFNFSCISNFLKRLGETVQRLGVLLFLVLKNNASPNFNWEIAGSIPSTKKAITGQESICLF